MKKLLLIPPLLMAAAGVAFAQADVETGKRIASQGANGVAACSSCHGAKGQGNAAGGFPRLAGLSVYYFTKQLHAFADGSRNNAIMTPIAKALTQQQGAALASYYAGLSSDKAVSAGAKGASGKQALDRARRLATTGDESRMLQACANCHGAGGSGEPPVYPYLAGQPQSYLENALHAWKSGERKTDPSGQMPAIAKKLDDADISALAAYYASLPPPKAAAQRASVPPKPGPAKDRPRNPSGGKANSTSSPGVGVEQGAGTVGGNQGPGGSNSGAKPHQTR